MREMHGLLILNFNINSGTSEISEADSNQISEQSGQDETLDDSLQAAGESA